MQRLVAECALCLSLTRVNTTIVYGALVFRKSDFRKCKCVARRKAESMASTHVS